MTEFQISLGSFNKDSTSLISYSILFIFCCRMGCLNITSIKKNGDLQEVTGVEKALLRAYLFNMVLIIVALYMKKHIIHPFTRK